MCILYSLTPNFVIVKKLSYLSARRLREGRVICTQSYPCICKVDVFGFKSIHNQLVTNLQLYRCVRVCHYPWKKCVKLFGVSNQNVLVGNTLMLPSKAKLLSLFNLFAPWSPNLFNFKFFHLVYCRKFLAAILRHISHVVLGQFWIKQDCFDLE